MKKLLSLLSLASALLVVMTAFCSCGTELDRSVRNADKQIADYNDPEKVNYGGKYSSELVYREADDEYDYIITVDIATYTGGAGYADKVENLVYNMKQTMNGYFSDNENVTVYVKVYNGDAFIRQYKNWELDGQ